MTKFLRRLWLDWLGFSLRGSRPIPDAEFLHRFIVVERWIDRKANKPKAGAFMPLPNGTWGTSVYRSFGADDDLLWRIGRVIASGTHAETVFGRALIAAGKIHSHHAFQLKSGRIPSLHRDIIGWPEKKADQKKVAEYLAGDATLLPSPK